MFFRRDPSFSMNKMASKEENVGSDNEIEETDSSQKKKPATHDSVGAADLDKVTDYVEEEDFSTQGLEEALKIAHDRQTKEGIDKQEREKALSKVKIRKEDVDLIINEMEIPRQVAERTLREHMGNVVEALADLQTTNLPEPVADGEKCDHGKSNESFLLCQRCDSTVLGPGLAKLVQKQFLLPHMRKKTETDDSESESLDRFWQVPTMHTFENVGFTKNVGTLKYLICADCEVGPIGVYETLEKDGFYVSVDRIRQGEEPKSRPRWP